MLEVWPYAVWLWAQLGAPLPELTDPEAPSRGQRVFFPEQPLERAAFRYAAQSGEACLSEASQRGLAFSRGIKPAPTAVKPRKRGARHKAPPPRIDEPVTLPNALHGVRFEPWSPWRRAGGKAEPAPVLDCRLLLALSDLAVVAKEHSVSVVRYSSIHRPGRFKKPGQGHPAGVAIDIQELELSDGRRWNIQRDFEGAGIGSRTCTLAAPWPRADVARALREFVCDLHARGSFNLLLTPHYDRQHEDHLHLEVRSEIRWVLMQ